VIDIEAKEYIIIKFYNEHEKPSMIAKELNVRPSYVTKIVQKDKKKYNAEKEYRYKVQREKRKKDKREWARKNRELKKELDDFIKLQHEQAAEELSEHKEISDLQYVKWNMSVYKYNANKKRFELNKKLKVSKDMPRHININWKISTQKYKPAHCF